MSLDGAIHVLGALLWCWVGWNACELRHAWRKLEDKDAAPKGEE